MSCLYRSISTQLELVFVCDVSQDSSVTFSSRGPPSWFLSDVSGCLRKLCLEVTSPPRLLRSAINSPLFSLGNLWGFFSCRKSSSDPNWECFASPHVSGSIFSFQKLLRLHHSTSQIHFLSISTGTKQSCYGLCTP